MMPRVCGAVKAAGHNRGVPSMLSQRIAARLAADREPLADLVQRLVAVPTENPPGVRYEECRARLLEAMETAGLEGRLLTIPSSTEAAVVAEHGHGPATVVFHGHYDVVPASVDGQFVARRQGDTIFGRGSSDMKSGLAAMLFAVKALKDEGVALDGRVRLLFVPDEETGGARGTHALAAHDALGSDIVAMLTAEPTSGVVWHANRGAITLAVTVGGRPAHVSLQHQGVNAFERAVDLVQRLQRLRDEVAERATALAVQPREARRSILLIGGEVTAGTNFNVVPDRCRFTIDRRINPEERLEDERRRLEAIFDDARREGIEVTVDVLQEGQASSTPADTPAAQALARGIAEVTGAPAAFEMCPGLLETRFYAERGIPALAYGPGILAVSHGPHEFVKLDRIVECATIYALTALDLLGGREA